MTDTLKPRDAKEVEDAVRWALGNDKALEVAGRGSKRAIGRPSQTDITLDLSALTGVTLYEPEELVLSAKAGTPLAEIEGLLGENGQELAFEPIDYGPLLGGPARSATLGGAIAANLSGPRRIKAGAARDHFLGVSAVTGRGDTIKSGGRVVKNVTGYDLCKVLAGSWGTLAAMTDITVKVLPKAETEATVAILGLDDARAAAAMAAAMGSPFDVSGAAHLPDHVASYFEGLPGVEAATVLRLEGFAPSVAHRKAGLTQLLKPFGKIEVIESNDSLALWRSIRDARPFTAEELLDRPLWRISTAPTKGHEIVASDHAGRADFLRLGWRPDLGRDAVCRRAGRRRRAGCGRGRRRSRHAHSCSGGSARRARCLSAAAGGRRRAEQAGQGQFRPQGCAQSRPDVGGSLIMQTTFTLAQLADPQLAEADKILRACVHCGFCTATCPTYVLLGDELDSPRGRIYLMKEMLEQERPATREVVKHIDRCLSCLACMTTCPAGVHYMHLVDQGRDHIEKTYTRPIGDRLIRALLAWVLPYPARFRTALVAGLLARPLAPLFWLLGFRRVAAMLRLTPARRPAPPQDILGKVYPAAGKRRGRVALLSGCVNPVLAPSTTEATIRLLNRSGIEVVIAQGESCCGSLVHHMGRETQALAQARNNIDAWTRELDGEGLDAIVITVSGCGTTIKDYGYLLRSDPLYARKAAEISALAKDVTEYLSGVRLPPNQSIGLTVAYHSACSLQHGQQVTRQPRDLLTKMGFVVKDVPEGHLCCGSAGTYNILQPELAGRLRARKIANIERTNPDVIATGNIGCMTQISAGTAIPVVHTVELIDWATGGPVPEALKDLQAGRGQGDTATAA